MPEVNDDPAEAGDDVMTREAAPSGSAKAERKRVQELSRLGRDLPAAWLERAIASGLTVDLARDQVLAYRAAQDELAPTSSIRTSTFDYMHRDTLAEARMELRELALADRMSNSRVKMPPDARPWRGRSLVDLAAEILEEQGVSTRMLSPSQIIQRSFPAHGTGDFPLLLTGSGARVLQDRYEAAEPEIKAVATMTSARDFRDQYRLRAGEFPELLPVAEHAEITYGTSTEEQESFRLRTFARIFSLTRQAIINDDLGAFTGFLDMAGRAAAELEGRLMVEVLTANGLMGDGIALFDNAHANIATGSALSSSSIGSMQAKLRAQTGPDGRVLNLPASALIVPANLEYIAKQIAAPINAVQTTEINPFGGKLKVATDARLDADSTTQYYVASDAVPHLSYAYLDGNPGPVLATDEDFSTMAMRMRVHLDFAAFVQDWRGLVRNVGTGGG